MLGDDSGGIRILFTSETQTRDEGWFGNKITGTFDFRPNEVHQEKKNQELQRFRLHQNRDFCRAQADGIIRLLQPTNHSIVTEIRSKKKLALTQNPHSSAWFREHNLVAYDGKNLASWDVTTGYPEVSFSALFGKLWYENYPSSNYVGKQPDMNPSSQNTAWYHFCLGLSKQLSTPCYLRHQLPFCSNLCKSIHDSDVKSRIKPTIEMMASLPSVVLRIYCRSHSCSAYRTQSYDFHYQSFYNPDYAFDWCLFVAIMATWITQSTIKLAISVVLVVALPLGVQGWWVQGRPNHYFDGDLCMAEWSRCKWLGRLVLALVSTSAMVAAFTISRFINPWLRQRSRKWGHWQTVLVPPAFIVGFFLLA